MNIRFYNARLLTMQEGEGIIENGEIRISDGKILFAGKTGEAKEEGITWDRESDLKGNLVMPGFKNAHTHSGMTFLRSFADDLPLDRWLFESIFPREAKLTEEDIYHCTKLAVLEYLSSGMTACFDMYLAPESTARATEEMGFRCVQVSGMSGQDPAAFEGALKKQEDLYRKLNSGSPLSSFILGFHAEYTTARELLSGLAELSRKFKAPVFTHNSETAKEVEECKGRYSLTPTELMEETGLFEYGGGGYHCVYLSEHDIEIFRKRNLSVVTNPGSNTKLASGIAPISSFLKAGINVAIGTDGPASNNCLDMFREMFLVTGLAKLHDQDASSVDGSQVLRMATVGGAKAMGLTDCDVLAPGKRADLIVIDLCQPNMQPLNDIAKNIVYSGSKTNVKLTMVDGRILYEDGEFHVGEDAERIYRDVQKVKDRIG